MAAVPAAVMLWVLLIWDPKSKKHWTAVVVMAVYLTIYYFVFIR